MKNKIIIRKLCIITLSLVILFSCTGMALGAEKTVRSDNTEFFQDIVDEYNELYGLDIGFGGFIDKNKDISVEEFRKEVEALAINQRKTIDLLDEISKSPMADELNSINSKAYLITNRVRKDSIYNFANEFYVEVTYSGDPFSGILSNAHSVYTQAKHPDPMATYVCAVHETLLGFFNNGTTLTAGQKVLLCYHTGYYDNIWLSASFYLNDLY